MKSVDLTSGGLIIVLSALLLAPAAVVVADTGASTPRPVIEVREPHKDGGVAEQGSVVTYQFDVVNRGQADLVVQDVQRSCGCTVTRWDRVIKPGAHGTIEAAMNTQAFQGAVSKHLMVFSNDPVRPQVELTISARLTPLIKVSPSPAAVLVVENQPSTREFTLERNGGVPMKIVQVLTYAPYIKAETTALPGQGRYKLTVTATPDAPLGRSTAAVVVWTDLPKEPSMTFSITVNRGIVTVPPMVFFGVIPREMKTPRQALVTIQRNSAPFHVKSVAVDDPHLAPKLETVRDGAEYRVTVTYAGGWDTTGVRRQMLTVTTDDRKQPVIAIPVQAAIQAKIASAPPVVRH
jgi:hypothetical protein